MSYLSMSMSIKGRSRVDSNGTFARIFTQSSRRELRELVRRVSCMINRTPERLKQAVAADLLLQFLRERIKQGGTPLRGYAEVCKVLGYKSSAGMYAVRFAAAWTWRATTRGCRW